MDDSNGYLSVDLEHGRAGAARAFRQLYGREPLEVLFAGDRWLVGPVPGANPMFEALEALERQKQQEIGRLRQGRLWDAKSVP